VSGSPSTAAQIVGRLIKAVDPAPREMPEVGSLVVEATHRLRARDDWPESDGVGYVERLEAEDGAHLTPYNCRVVLRLFDGAGERAWVNALFYVAPPGLGLTAHDPQHEASHVQ
jgi:hypothetical protein